MDAESLLEGAFDLHVHVAPDIVPRALDVVAMAAQCRDRGMGGFLTKDHLVATADRAVLAGRMVPGVQVFGAIVLNHPAGGLNPSAVSAAAGQGARAVFMPTFCAEHDIRLGGTAKGPYRRFVPPQGPPGIRILGPDGALMPGLDEILEIVRDAGCILGTGHLSPGESLALVKRASRIGVRKVVVTHASSPVVGMTPAEQKEAASRGAVIEHSYLPCLRGTPVAHILRDILAVGSQHCILTTDLGQAGNPLPVQGLTDFADALLQRGMDGRDIARMISINPRRLLDLE